MDKRKAINYLIGTFLMTYALWGIIIMANQFGYLKYGTPISMILFLIGGNAPPIVAYIILKKASVIHEFRQFFKEAFSIKQKTLHYFIMIVFLILYFGVPFLMQGITKGGDLYLGFLSIPLMILFGGLEELGWRYILQPALERRFAFGIATSITSVIWAIWHLPLFYIAGTGQSDSNFGLFTIMVFGMSFALATIYHLSKSIWLCILFHSMINAFSSTWIIEDSLEIKLFTAIVLIVLSLVFIRLYRKKIDIKTNSILGQ